MVSAVLCSSVAQASGTDFQFSSDFNVTLTSPNLTITIASGSTVAGFSVGSTTLTLNLDSGSNVTVKSSNFYTLTNSLGSQTQCAGGYSYVTFSGGSSPSNVTVTPSLVVACSQAAPIVTVTAPTAGSTIAGTSVTLSATATPSQGNTISQVQFQVDGSNVGAPVTTAPYNYSWDSTSVPDGSHTLTAVATDSLGTNGTSPGIVVTVQNNSGGGGGGGGGSDFTPPTIPTTLSALAVSQTEIDLSWAASTDNFGVTGYHIYRNGAAIATTQVTHYNDSVLQPDTTYLYSVSAYDAAGNVSAKSSPVSATTLAEAQTTPPPDIRYGQNVLIGNTVYFLDPSSSKRPYTSAGGFLSFGFNSFNTVLMPNQDEQNLPTGAFVYPMEGSLINDHGTVYVITSGERAGFTKAAVFLGLGYKWSNVIVGDTSFITTLPPINSTAQAHLPGTLINDKGTVYLIAPEGKIGIPSIDVFKSWGYSFGKAVLANAFDHPILQVGVMSPRAAGELSPY
jgi:hypothetical protein